MDIFQPLVSVIIPLYNSFKFLDYSLRSIINQTYDNLEIIIIDDSKNDDGSSELIASFKDSRIKYVRNKRRLGLVKSLNLGINLSSGNFIARMDGDDISHSERIERQVKYLNEHSDIGIISCNSYLINESNKVIGVIDHPYNDIDIKVKMFFDCAFVHPGVMIRRSLLDKESYDDRFFCAEDYELWSRCMNLTNFHNLKERLVKYRVLNSSAYHSQLNRICNDLDYYYKYRNVMFDIFYNTWSFYNKNSIAYINNYLDIMYPRNNPVSLKDREFFLLQCKKIILEKFPNNKYINRCIGFKWLIWSKKTFWKTHNMSLLLNSIISGFYYFEKKYLALLYGFLWVNNKIYKW